MHSFIYLNNRVMTAAKARVSPLTSAALYGRGVFTTLAVYNGCPFLWTEHWARLTEHATRIGVEWDDYDEARVTAALYEIIAANRVEHGRARVTLFAKSGQGVWKVPRAGAQKTELLLMTGEPRAINDDGLALTVSPFRINTMSPLAGVKSVNYLDHILAWEEARARDFDEAVALNERGEVVSATMANIFWTTHGHLYTPALATGAMNGTTRAQVFALAQELSVPVIEGIYELSHLADADEIFLTSAGLGVGVVMSFDFHRYTVPVGSIALRIRESFRQLTLHAG